MVTNKLPFLDENQVRAVLSYEELIPAIRQALMDFSAGRVQQPVRAIIPVSSYGGWFGIMPAVYGTVMGAKMVTFYPGNADRQMHTHMAIIQLFRSDTGEPLATMDGRLITEMRTAAVSAVAIDHLAHPQAKVLGILGSGVQARSHFRALAGIRSFAEVRVWSRTQDHAQQFAAEIGAHVTTAEEAVSGAGDDQNPGVRLAPHEVDAIADLVAHDWGEDVGVPGTVQGQRPDRPVLGVGDVW